MLRWWLRIIDGDGKRRRVRFLVVCAIWVLIFVGCFRLVRCGAGRCTRISMLLCFLMRVLSIVCCIFGSMEFWG